MRELRAPGSERPDDAQAEQLEYVQPALPPPDDRNGRSIHNGRGTGWKPNKHQLAYLDLWLDPGKPRNVPALAQLIGITPRAVYGWNRTPSFVQWFNAEVEAATEHLWKPILHKCSSLALQGSVEHAKLIAQIRGALRDDASPMRGGVTVVVGVPRPGDAVVLPELAQPALPPVTAPEQ